VKVFGWLFRQALNFYPMQYKFNRIVIGFSRKKIDFLRGLVYDKKKYRQKTGKEEICIFHGKKEL